MLQWQISMTMCGRAYFAISVHRDRPSFEPRTCNMKSSRRTETCHRKVYVADVHVCMLYVGTLTCMWTCVCAGERLKLLLGIYCARVGSPVTRQGHHRLVINKMARGRYTNATAATLQFLKIEPDSLAFRSSLHSHCKNTIWFIS